MSTADSVAARIDGDRLWRRLMRLAEIGATANGGVNRQAFSAEDIAARQLLTDWARELGCVVTTDEIGNLFAWRAGRDATNAPVMTGSHLDSQPTGGKFDGAYGVIAALEVVNALVDAGIKTELPVEVVAWANEEGGRFQPGAMGSAIFAGRMTMADVADALDADGVRLRDAVADTLEAAPGVKKRPPGAPHAYLEAHIEQGPILEARGLQVGVVSDIQGIRQFRVDVRGSEAHAGTTPMRQRRDAVRAATALIGALETRMDDPHDQVRFTVGRFEVRPGSPNTVPSHVLFTIDLRHPDAATIDRLAEAIADACAQPWHDCDVAIAELIRVAPTHFDDAVVRLVRDSAAALGLPSIDMVSGAGHDAMFLANLCPTGMIFVPCENGLSHNEAENAKPADLAAGAAVLARAVVALADGSGA